MSDFLDNEDEECFLSIFQQEEGELLNKNSISHNLILFSASSVNQQGTGLDDSVLDADSLRYLYASTSAQNVPINLGDNDCVTPKPALSNDSIFQSKNTNKKEESDDQEEFGEQDIRTDIILDTNLEECNSLDLELEMNKIYQANGEFLDDESDSDSDDELKNVSMDKNFFLNIMKKISFEESKEYLPLNTNDLIVEDEIKQQNQEQQEHEEIVYERSDLIEDANYVHEILLTPISNMNDQIESEQQANESSQDCVEEKDVETSINSSSSKTKSICKSNSESNISEKSNTVDEISDQRCPFNQKLLSFAANVVIPSTIKDLVLWKDAKLSASIFVIVLLLLVSLSTYSFLTVISSLPLLVLTIFGSFRFLMDIMFKVGGRMFFEFEFSLSDDQIRKLIQIIDTDTINALINQIKLIIIWDDIFRSGIVYVFLYVIYSIGFVMNALTLLKLVWIGMFILPKLYEIYKNTVDHLVEQIFTSFNAFIQQALEKISCY